MMARACSRDLRVKRFAPRTAPACGRPVRSTDVLRRVLAVEPHERDEVDCIARALRLDGLGRMQHSSTSTLSCSCADAAAPVAVVFLE